MFDVSAFAPPMARQVMRRRWSATFGEPRMSEVIRRATGEVHFDE